MIPLIGVIIGLLIGLLWNIEIPAAFTSYIAVCILAAIDSIIGAINANFKNNYNTKLFVSGFIGNSLLAIILTALGEQLNLQLSLAAVFAFGNRIFVNFAIMRRMLLSKRNDKKELEAEDSDLDTEAANENIQE